MGKDLGTTGFTEHTDTFPGIYRAKIVSNTDPLYLGRVKAEVYPMLVGLSADDLPWIVPAQPIFCGAGSGTGYFAVPDVGSNVFVFFEQGDIYQGVYFAEAPDTVKGLPAERLSNYPKRRVVKTAGGLIIYVDDTSKEMKITHPTGTTITVTPAGGVEINSISNVIITGSIVSINP